MKIIKYIFIVLSVLFLSESLYIGTRDYNFQVKKEIILDSAPKQALNYILNKDNWDTCSIFTGKETKIPFFNNNSKIYIQDLHSNNVQCKQQLLYRSFFGERFVHVNWLSTITKEEKTRLSCTISGILLPLEGIYYTFKGIDLKESVTIQLEKSLDRILKHSKSIQSIDTKTAKNISASKISELKTEVLEKKIIENLEKRKDSIIKVQIKEDNNKLTELESNKDDITKYHFRINDSLIFRNATFKYLFKENKKSQWNQFDNELKHEILRLSKFTEKLKNHGELIYRLRYNKKSLLTYLTYDQTKEEIQENKDSLYYYPAYQYLRGARGENKKYFIRQHKTSFYLKVNVEAEDLKDINKAISFARTYIKIKKLKYNNEGLIFFKLNEIKNEDHNNKLDLYIPIKFSKGIFIGDIII